MANSGIRYVGTLKKIHDAIERLIGQSSRKNQPQNGAEAQPEGEDTVRTVRHEGTMKQIRNAIEYLTGNRAQWDHQENGWELRLSADIAHPDWPSKQWMILAERRKEGTCTVSLHVDFGGKEQGSGYTMSEYLFFDVTADEFIVKINEPGFAESFYDDLEEMERKVRKHEFP